MHKQFQKLALLLNRDVDPKLNDNYVKYLYKRETDSFNKESKRKIKSANDAEEKHLKKHKEESARKKKSTSSIVKKHKRKDLLSETEIVYISPDEIKKQRKKSKEGKKKYSYHTCEIEEPCENAKARKDEDDIVKLIKHYKSKFGGTDFQRLSKDQIFNIISNVKEVPKTSSARSHLLKKFFVVDEEREEKVRLKKEHKRSKTEDIYIPQETKKTEKIRKHREQSIDVLCAKESKKSRDKESFTKKPKSSTEKNKLVFDELKPEVKKHKKKLYEEPESRDKSRERTASAKSSKHLEEKKKKVDRTNPLRHKFCLVKNTFSIIEIAPKSIADDLEGRKRRRAFKKYYRYSKSTDSEATSVSAFNTFSDSHKMYQDRAEESAEDAPQRHKKNKKVKSSKLQLETHVSSVIINPEPKISKDERKIKSKKSKIPIWNKIIEPVVESRSRKQSNELFPPKTSERNKTFRQIDSPSNTARTKKIEEKVSPKPKKAAEPIVPPLKLNSNRKNAEKSVSNSRANSTRSSLVEKTNSSKANSTRSSFVAEKANGSRANSTRSSLAEKPKSIKSSKASSLVGGSKDFKIEIYTPENKYRPVPQKNASKASTLSKKLPTENSRTGRKISFDNTQKVRSPSYDAASSICSKKTNKTSLGSNSDTNLQKRKVVEKKKPFDRSSAKTSISNSTCGDRSICSSKNGTSFFLTKSYKDEEKLNRWHKRKMYADTVRKRAISKSQKPSGIPTPVLEVRYLTVEQEDQQHEILINKSQKSRSQLSAILDGGSTEKEFYANDLEPYIELVDDDRFKVIFDLPCDEGLDEILNENENFLKKDFSFSLSQSESSESLSSSDHKITDWYNFKIGKTESSNKICDVVYEIKQSDLDLGSQDQIIDSLSAPGSEESGYATIKSRRLSKSFFERPDIKVLLKPTYEDPIDDLYFGVETSNSSCGVEIHSIESKSMQATVDFSQKSVQIKLSKEEESFSPENEEECEEPVITNEEHCCSAEPVVENHLDAHVIIVKKFETKRKHRKTRNKKIISKISCFSCVSRKSSD